MMERLLLADFRHWESHVFQELNGSNVGVLITVEMS